jgi:hypothetical protein
MQTLNFVGSFIMISYTLEQYANHNDDIFTKLLAFGIFILLLSFLETKQKPNQ